MIIDSFVLPLLITIIIECLIAYLFGFRDKLFYLALVVLNFATNPFFNLALLYIQDLKLFDIYFIAIFLLVVITIIVEWRSLSFCFKGQSMKLLLLSTVMNLASLMVCFMFYRYFF